MAAATRPLPRDPGARVAAAPRPCLEVGEVWRTDCPRLAIREDAVAGGFVAFGPGAGRALLAGRCRGV